ncbi:hypothetical protein [Azospirillum sp. B4]|uniref:hypothetical protein n=1 Tax=Azospirillum sp. B4 TaxID=95605 RepID=UPI00034941B5|nr:hypothetical protein [Azospirillum sp. B4]
MTMVPTRDDTATDHPAVTAAWRDRRRHGLNPYPVLTPAGLVLGAGTVLAKLANDTWAPQALQIDADRLLALLSIAYDRRHTVDQAHRILAKVQAASRALAAGEPVQAAIHLAHACLGALPDPDAARRLFLAETLLDQGMGSDALVKAACLPLAKYSPEQPRDDHGRWTSGSASGDTTVNSAARDTKYNDFRSAITPIGYDGERNWSSSRAGSGNQFKKLKPYPEKPGNTTWKDQNGKSKSRKSTPEELEYFAG